jgi:SAM-dependent methyltransferase
MRNWNNHDSYLNELLKDIYPQPEDKGHTALAQKVIDTWMSIMTTCKSVLDLGCGTGFCQPMFERWNVEYEGICLGEDFIHAQDNGRNVRKMDFSFLDYDDGSFDLLFARHSLEHSPMPLLTLMEWARVSRSWLGIVLPHPDWYGYRGMNHYSVMNHEQILNLLDNAGWKVLWDDVDKLPVKDEQDEGLPPRLVPHEFWIMAEKKTI